MRAGRFCFWHDPGTGAEAKEASRLGGLRRRRERALAAAFDVAGLGSAADIRRALEIAYLDTLNLDNSVARTRALVAVATAAMRLLEVEELRAFSVDLDED